MNDYLRQSLEALGLPVIEPEPEVVRAQLANIKCRTLAQLIAGALREEPLLRVEVDGCTVRVREVGGDAAMKFTVEGE